jgi:hypothetical protein
MSDEVNEEYPKRAPEEMIEKLRAQMRVAAEAKGCRHLYDELSPL